MSTAKEFALIPKEKFMKEQPYYSQILNDTIVQHTDNQFSFLNPMQPNENANKEYHDIFDKRETIDPNELSKVHVDKIFHNLNMLAPPKFIRTEKIVNLIKDPKRLS